ncbi:MAG: hypothetical protein ACI8R4_002012 [Paracoccaceae bacterium]|jgi:hypothetical protein
MAIPPIASVKWAKTHRIIRSRFPPIDLFEDIADPSDWDAILSAESKTNPRIAESVGMLDLVPDHRRVAGEGASWAMAPFVDVSTDRPSRFSDGRFGVYYAGNRVEVALFETIHHHARFLSATRELAGWTSDFRELTGTLDADLNDVTDVAQFGAIYHPDDYAASQTLASDLRNQGANGMIYRSVRFPEGLAAALFWPDVVGLVKQGQHFSYYWDGTKVTQVKNLTSGDVFAVLE